MANFTSNLKPNLPCLEIDHNMELINQFHDLNSNVIENLNLNSQNFMGFSNDTFFYHQTPQFPINFGETFPGSVFHSNNQNLNMPMNQQNDQFFHDSVKRKLMEFSESSNSGISSPPVSENGLIKKKNSTSRRGKKAKMNGDEDEKPKEVVHVRARRGQATDSHSLAERVRRGKINERLNCLQDIVPGCYKTMGMAVMLDEIINYVQSLQNQVEFLSMKLTAASTFYDFNSDSATLQTLQKAKAQQEIVEMERLIKEANGGLAFLQATWPN